MLHIVIADDHEIVRNGLEMLISSQDDMRVIAEASSYVTLLDLLKHTHPHLLILDLNLGDRNGLKILDDITVTYPDLRILILSAYPEETHALRAFKGGALGYLNKAVAASELIDAIKAVQQGKYYVSRSFLEHLPYGTDLKKSSKKINELLSKREFEVLSLIASGHTSSQIAETLGLSPKTISTYKARIMEKLQVNTPVELVKIACEQFSSPF